MLLNYLFSWDPYSARQKYFCCPMTIDKHINRSKKTMHRRIIHCEVYSSDFYCLFFKCLDLSELEFRTGNDITFNKLKKQMDASTVVVSIVCLYQLKPAWLLLMLVHSWFNLWNSQEQFAPKSKKTKCQNVMTKCKMMSIWLLTQKQLCGQYTV